MWRSTSGVTKPSLIGLKWPTLEPHPGYSDHTYTNNGYVLTRFGLCPDSSSFLLYSTPVSLPLCRRYKVGTCRSGNVTRFPTSLRWLGSFFLSILRLPEGLWGSNYSKSRRQGRRSPNHYGLSLGSFNISPSFNVSPRSFVFRTGYLTYYHLRILYGTDPPKNPWVTSRFVWFRTHSLLYWIKSRSGLLTWLQGRG